MTKPEKAARLYLDEKLTVAEVASELGVSRPTAYKWLRDSGVKIEKRKMRPSTRYSREELEDLYVEQGLSLREIAERFGVTTPSVHSALAKYEIPHRGLGAPSKAFSVKDLELGETIIVPFDISRKWPASAYYEEARKVGVRITVRLDRAKGEMRITRLPEISREAVMELWEQGMNKTEIARVFMIGRGKVAEIVDDF
jgi:excisionase family DNA binding protein